MSTSIRTVDLGTYLVPKENHVANLTFILILFLSDIPEMDLREMG
jgi:hypothetical protein